MGLKAKQIIIALLSIAILVVLGFVVYTEKEHVLVKRTIVVKSDSAGCVHCHGTKDKEGGPGKDPGIVAHWKASEHAVQGVGCMDCHGVPKAGEIPDEQNPRYVVRMAWDKNTGLKTKGLVKKDGKPYLVYEFKKTPETVPPPLEHHKLQAAIYCWLTGAPMAYLVYAGRAGFREYAVNVQLTDGDIVKLVKEATIPRWGWECRLCRLRAFCPKYKASRAKKQGIPSGELKVDQGTIRLGHALELESHQGN